MYIPARAIFIATSALGMLGIITPWKIIKMSRLVFLCWLPGVSNMYIFGLSDICSVEMMGQTLVLHSSELTLIFPNTPLVIPGVAPTGVAFPETLGLATIPHGIANHSHLSSNTFSSEN